MVCIEIWLYFYAKNGLLMLKCMNSIKNSLRQLLAKKQKRRFGKQGSTTISLSVSTVYFNLCYAQMTLTTLSLQTCPILLVLINACINLFQFFYGILTDRQSSKWERVFYGLHLLLLAEVNLAMLGFYFQSTGSKWISDSGYKKFSDVHALFLLIIVGLELLSLLYDIYGFILYIVNMIKSRNYLKEIQTGGDERLDAQNIINNINQDGEVIDAEQGIGIAEIQNEKSEISQVYTIATKERLSLKFGKDLRNEKFDKKKATRSQMSHITEDNKDKKYQKATLKAKDKKDAVFSEVKSNRRNTFWKTTKVGDQNNIIYNNVNLNMNVVQNPGPCNHVHPINIDPMKKKRNSIYKKSFIKDDIEDIETIDARSNAPKAIDIIENNKTNTSSEAWENIRFSERQMRRMRNSIINPMVDPNLLDKYQKKDFLRKSNLLRGNLSNEQPNSTPERKSFEPRAISAFFPSQVVNNTNTSDKRFGSSMDIPRRERYKRERFSMLSNVNKSSGEIQSSMLVNKLSSSNK